MCVSVGNIVAAEQIMANLQFIIADKSAAPSHPVGYLTCEPRDLWSTVREKLASAGRSVCLFICLLVSVISVVTF